MAELAGLILDVIGQIADIARDVEEISYQAGRLVERIAALEAPVRAIRERRRSCPVEALGQLQCVLDESRIFLEMYSRSTRFTRVTETREHMKALERLGAGLTECVQALHFGMAVATWNEEDEVDRSRDLDGMMEVVEGMEMARLADHAEVMRALQVRGTSDSR